MKFLIARASEENKIAFLVNEANKLFEADAIWEAKEDFCEIFGATLQIGKGIETKSAKDCFFAAALGGLEELPNGWSFVELVDLNPENCPDYDIIKIAQEKLGY